MCVSTVLTIAGGIFEIAGFFLVSVDLYRLQRREFGPLWFERAFAASRLAVIRTWRKVTGQTTIHYGSATGTATATGTAKGTFRVGTGTGTIEERVAALEANFTSLDSEVGEQRIELNDAVNRVQGNLEEALTELRQKQELREAKEKSIRRQSLKFQWAGIPLFLFGVVLSVLGNIAAC